MAQDQGTLGKVLKEMNSVWEELLSLTFVIGLDSDEAGEPVLERRTEASHRKKRKEELLDKARRIIADNREMLVENLASEIATIRRHGGLYKVPEEITRPKHLRFSVANWVIGSMS